jgi:hypothetical protein
MTPVTLQTRELVACDRALEAFYRALAYAAATLGGVL